MDERDIVFRDKLIALVADLNGGEGRDRDLRRLIGLYANRLARDAGVRDWADLKVRAERRTVNSLLTLFEKQGAEAAKAGETRAIRAFEVLALSIIARDFEHQTDLAQGIDILDRYITECATNVRRAGAQFVPPAAKKVN